MSTARRLRRDQDGAIMLLGLFMAVFLVGMLYHVVGIGDAILHRERMQDAADAAAFSGAVLHARGMNLIVLINLTMAAVLAILVSLKLLQSLLVVALVLCAALSFFVPALASAIPHLSKAQADVARAHQKAKKFVMPALKGLNRASGVLASAVPWTAQVRVIDTAMRYGPATGGFAIPARISLPVEDDKFSVLCGRAGGFVGDLVARPLPGAVRDELSGAIADLTKGGSAWFCDDLGSPPRLDRSLDVSRPELGSTTKCLEASKSGGTDENACKDAEAEERAAVPDPKTGLCVEGTYRDSARQTREACRPGGPYDERVRAARAQCNHQKDAKLKRFVWQERSVTRTWRFFEGSWIQDEDQYGEPTLQQPERRDGEFQSIGKPCDRSAGFDDWSAEVGPRFDDPMPVCSSADFAMGGWDKRSEHVDEFTEVLHVFSCAKKEPIEAPDISGTIEGGPSQSSKKIIKDLSMGADDFQLRAVVFGGLPSKKPANVVKVAAWGRDTGSVGSSLADWAKHGGRLSVAQAEYYFDGGDKRAEWMWSMNWRARLRRFRMPEPDARPTGPAEVADPSFDTTTGVGDACRALPGDHGCGELEDKLSLLDRLLIH